jgi:hypothetical protein
MDPTAQTEPLTEGQSIVAKWESLTCPWSEPADLAEAIDEAIAAEREACAKIAEGYWGGGMPEDDRGEAIMDAAYRIAEGIRERSKQPLPA